jgi:hypothetical protein
VGAAWSPGSTGVPRPDACSPTEARHVAPEEEIENLPVEDAPTAGRPE